MSTVSVLNTDAGLSGKTLVNADDTQTITGAKTFSRSPSAPFVVTASSAVVPNLDADKLDGQDGSYYTTSTNITGQTDICDGRLTLTTATPVTVADVTAAGTIYFAPYKGHRIALYDGVSAWTTYAFTELSLALTATSGSLYDVFVYASGGVPTLETLVWTNTTTRATALTTQNGVLVKSGATTRRYLGTFCASGANVTEDSKTKRYLFNYYNRVARSLERYETTASWTYTTATVRQANGAAANQVEIVNGWQESPLDLSLSVVVQNSNGAAINVSAGIGEDSTTTYVWGNVGVVSSGSYVPIPVRGSKVPAVGKHVYSWNEWSTNTATTTWFATTAAVGSTQTSGLSGLWWC